MSLSPNAKSPCASTAGLICPSSSHRISSKNPPPFLGGMGSPCASSNKALTWPTRQANSDPWKSRLVTVKHERKDFGGANQAKNSETSSTKTVESKARCHEEC